MSKGSGEQQKVQSNFDPAQSMSVPRGFEHMMNGDFDARLKRLQSAASEMQEACGQAFSRQMESFGAIHQTFAHLLEKAPQITQPKEAVAQASEFVAAVVESASEQSRTWANLAQKCQETCARIVRETAEEMRK